MICKHCGAQVLDGKRFCTKCGQPLSAPADAAAGTLPEQRQTVLQDSVPTSAENAARDVAQKATDGADSQCPWCGAPSAGRKFCPVCGRPLSDGEILTDVFGSVEAESAQTEDADEYDVPPEYSLPETPLEKLAPVAKQAGEKLANVSKKAAEEGKKAAREGGEAAKKAWAFFVPFLKSLPGRWKAFEHKKTACIGAVGILVLICGIIVASVLLAPKGVEAVAYNASNMLNGGRVLVSGEDVYVARDDGLYRVKTDGTCGEQLNVMQLEGLQTADGRLYGIDTSGSLWRLDTRNGETKNIPFSGDVMEQMLVYGESIYYTVPQWSEYGTPGLYKMALDGGSNQLLAEGNFRTVQIADENLYAMTEDCRFLRFDLDGENVSVVWQGVADSNIIPVVYGGKMYYILDFYSLWDENSALPEEEQAVGGVYAVDFATGERTLVLETEKLADPWMPGFSIDDESGMLYCVKETEGNRELICADLNTGAQRVLRKDALDAYDWETTLVFGDQLAVYEASALDALRNGTMLLCAADGSIQQPLMSPLAKSIAAVNGAVYFSTADGVYRVQLDGSGLVRVAAAPSAELLAMDSTVYYNGAVNGLADVYGISRLEETGATLVQQGVFGCWTLTEDGTPVFIYDLSGVLCQNAQGAAYGAPLCRLGSTGRDSVAAFGGWAYVENRGESDYFYDLLRVNMAGTECESLCPLETDLPNLKVSADGVYFIEAGNLKRISVSGEEVELVAWNVSQYVLYNGTVYYTNAGTQELCSVIPGVPSSEKVLVRTAAASLAVQGQRLYYCDLLDKGALYVLDLATSEHQRLLDSTDGAADKTDYVCAGVPEQPDMWDPYVGLEGDGFTLLGGGDVGVPIQQPGESAGSMPPSSLSGNEDMDGAAIAFGRFYDSYIEAIRAMDTNLLEYCSGPCAEEMSTRIFNQNKDYVYDIVYLAVDFDSMELQNENGMQTVTFNTETYCMVYERDGGENAGDNQVPRRVKAVKNPENGAWYIDTILSSHDRAPEVGNGAVDVYPYI